ncbi:MAG: HlyD family efflux transporter periplasmic adaptor subunit [Candidatus Zixiibacteriota bacterium]
MDRPIQKKKWPPKRIALFSGTGLIVFLLVYVFYSTSGSSTLKIDSQKITISEVISGKFQEYIPINGTVMPISTFYLDASEGGKVEQTYLEEGSFVNTGDSIMRLDNTDLHLDIMYREAQLFEQINNLRNTRLAIEQNSLTLRGQLVEIEYQIQKSKRRFDQSVGLKEKNLISEDEFEQARDDFEYWTSRRDLTFETQRQDSILRAIQISQLEVSVERMQANLEVVKSKLDNLVLRAPVAGQLTSLIAEIGESKSRGERLGQIDILDGFKIRAAVDEYYISRISKGQEGTVKIASEEYDLIIRKVYPEVREGRFQIDMEFNGPEPDGIRRGQTVQIRLALGDLADAVMLARGGFYQKTGGNWVYVVDKSGRFATKRNISLGMYNPQVYQVLEHLEPGEKVITSSYDNFGDYDKLIFEDQ